MAASFPASSQAELGVRPDNLHVRLRGGAPHVQAVTFLMQLQPVHAQFSDMAVATTEWRSPEVKGHPILPPRSQRAQWQ